MSFERRLLVRSLVVAAVVGGVGFVSTAPAYARPSGGNFTSDLAVRLENRVDGVPGKRVTYTVVVTNRGPSPAKGIDISYRTSVSLQNIEAKINLGTCQHTPTTATCHRNRALKPGRSAFFFISGVVPVSEPTGALVNNTVSVRSATTLTNTRDDSATDNYHFGVGSATRTIPPPFVAPSAPPSARASHPANRAAHPPTARVTRPAVVVPHAAQSTSKLTKITDTAAKVGTFSTRVAHWTFIALGVGVVWFIIGLAWHHRRRVAEADFDRNDEGDD